MVATTVSTGILLTPVPVRPGMRVAGGGGGREGEYTKAKSTEGKFCNWVVGSGSFVFCFTLYHSYVVRKKKAEAEEEDLCGKGAHAFLSRRRWGGGRVSGVKKYTKGGILERYAKLV